MNQPQQTHLNVDLSGSKKQRGLMPFDDCTHFALMLVTQVAHHLHDALSLPHV
jgi:hypothetical protein